MKWEYAVEEMIIDEDAFQMALNMYGDEGWELVSVVPYGRPGGKLVAVILKRPKSDDFSN